MGRIPDDIILRLAGTPLENVARSVNPSAELLNDGSSRLKTNCFMHNDTRPSLKIEIDQNRYWCYVCNKGGNVIDYVRGVRKVGFVEALDYLARHFYQNDPDVIRYFDGNGVYHHKEKEEIKFNLDSPDRDVLLKLLGVTQEFFQERYEYGVGPKVEEARGYLAKRDIKGSLIEKLGVGFAPGNDSLFFELRDRVGDKIEVNVETLKSAGLFSGEYRIFGNRITFPIMTRSGRVLGFTGRSLKNNPEKKYVNSSQSEVFDKGHYLFGLDKLDDKSVREHGLFLVEGFTDLCGFLEQGVNSALVLGSTSLTNHHAGIIDELMPNWIYLVNDGDSAGIVGTLKNCNRLRECLSTTQIKALPMPSGKDPFDVFFTEGESILDYAEMNSVSPEEFFVSNIGVLRSHLKDNVSLAHFINEHTRYLIDLKTIDKLKLPHSERKESKFHITKPHPLVLGKQ